MNCQVVAERPPVIPSSRWRGREVLVRVFAADKKEVLCFLDRPRLETRLPEPRTIGRRVDGLPNSFSYHSALVSRLAQLTCAKIVRMLIRRVSIEERGPG